MKRQSQCLVLAWLACATSTMGVARADTNASAQALFDEGRALLAKGEYAKACAAFEESQQVESAVGTQLNVARCYEEWGKVATAYAAYRQAAKMAASKKDERFAVASERADKLENAVPRLRIDAPDSPGLEVRVNDTAYVAAVLSDWLLLDPGEHVVMLRRGSRELDRETVSLARGDKKIVKLELAPSSVGTVVDSRAQPKKMNGRRWLGVGLAATGAVSSGIGLAVGISARSKYNSAFPTHCDKQKLECDATGQAITESARKQGNIGTIVGGLGAVALVAGAVVFFTAPKPGDSVESEAGFWLTPEVSADSAALTLWTKF